MAIYHLDLTTVRRSLGRSIVQLVAYVTGTTLRDHRTGKLHTRESKDDVITVGEMGPDMDQENLWNLAEGAERRRDSVVGRHIIVALPHDVPVLEQWRLLKEFAARIHRDTGAPLVFAMHENYGRGSKPRNSHGHIVLATRRWDSERCDFGEKTRELDVPNIGGRIIESWREAWEVMVNCALPRGVAKISRLSHKRAGRQRRPRKHLGAVASAVERRGLESFAGSFNRTLDQLDRAQSEITLLKRESEEIGLEISDLATKVLLPPAVERVAGYDAADSHTDQILELRSLAAELAEAERAIANGPSTTVPVSR